LGLASPVSSFKNKKKDKKKSLLCSTHLGVIFESTGRISSRKVPQTKGLVPGARKSKVSIRREDDVRNEVRVAIETLLGDTSEIMK